MGSVEFQDEQIVEEEVEKIRKQKSHKRVFILLVFIDILLLACVITQVTLTILRAIESLG